MKVGTSILCGVVFVFSSSASAFAEVGQLPFPEQCIAEERHTGEEQHVYLKECTDRLSMSSDENPVDECAFGPFCGPASSTLVPRSSP